MSPWTGFVSTSGCGPRASRRRGAPRRTSSSPDMSRSAASGEAGPGGRRRRHARDPARAVPPHRRRYRCSPSVAGRRRSRRRSTKRPRVARGAGAARARAAAGTAARCRSRGTSDEAGAAPARRAAARAASAMRWVAFLRAVNVGGRNKVPMAELRDPARGRRLRQRADVHRERQRPPRRPRRPDGTRVGARAPRGGCLRRDDDGDAAETERSRRNRGCAPVRLEDLAKRTSLSS